MIFSKKCLGIDIGASAIKVVEISSFGRQKKLENYFEFSLLPGFSSMQMFYRKDLLLASDKVADVLSVLLKKVKIKQKKVIFSLPDFSTFFIAFSLPPMSETEVPQAIEFEARHYIPLPLSEVNFDWQILEKQETMAGIKLKVLLVVIPKNVLQKYQKMATLSQLEVRGMGAEAFGLIKSSIPKEKRSLPVCMVDIGWQSTAVSIVQDEKLIVSHSFDISGIGLTKTLSEELGLSFEKAEELKKNYGLDPQREDISEILSRELNSLAGAINKICQDFSQTSSQPSEIKDIIIAGGSALLFGLKEYLEVKIGKNVQIANPFSSISYPNALRPRLKEIGPSFAVAVGMGIMGVES